MVNTVQISDSTPDILTNADHQRAWRKRNPDKVKARKKQYRHDNSRHQTSAAYLARNITAWDGEGITREDGSHIYVMFAVLTDGDEDYLFNEDGLGTAELFDFILDFAKRNPGNINTIYGGGYDFNMWLRDVPLQILEELYHQKFTTWRGYRMAWRRGKSFYIARIDDKGNAIEGVTIYDCVSFFQTSFINACDSYLGDQFYKRKLIVDNKALRSSFTAADVPTVREYNKAELINLVRLMKELRSRLNKVGLRPKRWDGPGAVASALMLRENVKAARKESPPDVAKAARYAYAGGRFEVLKFGSVNDTAYEYDINSAYPAALRDVPDLARGEWKYREGDPGDLPFAMYHIKYTGKRADLPGAFYCRDAKGAVSYPMKVEGWYWSPEIKTAREYCKLGYGTMTIVGAWEYVEATEARPFAFINKLYRARKILKQQGDGAHVGIKLGLNSLYGKLAQQVGAEKRRGEWRIPPFHQLEWAGYTTSWCRARILGAVLHDLDKVIAFETDAVFTTGPINVPTDDELGDYDALKFKRLTYIQSGMYFGETSDGKRIEKTRGVDKGAVGEKDVLKIYRIPKAIDRRISAPLTRFIGLGLALAQDVSRWRRWETITKRVQIEPTGKRIHADCACMTTGAKGLQIGVWHRTACPIGGGKSHEFPILWENPPPGMDALAELRDANPDWE